MNSVIKRKSKNITLKMSLVGVLVAGIVGLVVYNMRDMLFGAPFDVHTAADGATLTETFVALTGDAAHAKELLINGRPVAIDRAGAFTDGVILSPGYNIVEIALHDRFGNTNTKTYHWFMEPPASVAAAGVGAEPARYINQTHVIADTIPPADDNAKTQNTKPVL